MEDDRTVDRLLEKIKAEEEKKQRGKLKIFFGYAAGIGKTYAMLSFAHQEKEHGEDIVIGYIEPHDRPETLALSEGLEQIPAKEMRIGEHSYREFDLDQALRRNPRIILVDELAHTNIKGSRHEKRYQDVEELLKAGIDVYTTLNVQHLESLHDTVAGITNISVQERIPDSVFDQADLIKMIDVTPEELLQRLKKGKIYRQERARQAMEHFFTVENLAALREIALRRMADWVNQEQDLMLGTREGNSSEHIMMCLSPSPSNSKVIRQAARMAKAFHGKFTAFYVETPDFSEMSREDRKRLAENTRLAEKLGAKTITSYGSDIVEQMAEYARVAHVTKLVLGRSYTKKPLFSLKESYSDQLLTRLPELEIFLIPAHSGKTYRKERKKLQVQGKFLQWDCMIILGILLVATLLSILFRKEGLKESNLIMVYELGVLAAAFFAHYKLSSIIYSILSIFVFNYLFTVPFHTFLVDDPGYIITFVVMFTTAFITSTTTIKMKQIAKQTALKSYRTEILLETSQKLQGALSEKGIAEQMVGQIGKLLNKNVICYIGNPVSDSEPVTFVYDGEIRTFADQPGERAVAEWCYKNSKRAGAGTTTLPGAKCRYLAVRNGEAVFAVIGIQLEKDRIPAYEESILFAILNEGALAFEKSRVLEKERRTTLELEQEQLRANLLRSISHDLRTPLTSISGNAVMLLEDQKNLDDGMRNQIYNDIYDDSQWLMNLIENLLSVTRIENGAMLLHRQPQLLDDIITEALKMITRRSSEHNIRVVQEEDIIVADMDARLIIQVLVNLLDNAVKHTQKGSEITVSVSKRNGTVLIKVSDNGPGVQKEQQEKIFDMFYSGDGNITDSRRGMGLGLSLCKSIVEAHGGRIWVEENHPVGASFCFTIKAEEVSIA